MRLNILLHHSVLPVLCGLAFVLSASATAIARDIYTSKPPCDAASVTYRPRDDVAYVPDGTISSKAELKAETDGGASSSGVELKIPLGVALSDVTKTDVYNLPNAKESQFSVGEVQLHNDGIASVSTVFDVSSAQPAGCGK